jgi:hypothetical protein
MTFDVASFKVSPAVKKILTEIREGKRPDPHGWLMKL